MWHMRTMINANWMIADSQNGLPVGVVIVPKLTRTEELIWLPKRAMPITETKRYKVIVNPNPMICDFMYVFVVYSFSDS